MLRFTPTETKFFGLFEEMSSHLDRGARILVQLLSDSENLEVAVEQLKHIEHDGDQTTHGILTRLNQTFITPFDREDVHLLAASLDDVLDLTYAAGERVAMYRIPLPLSAATELAQILTRQVEEIRKAVSLLEKHGQLLPHCVEINRLENEADRIARAAVGALFERERDPITLVKIKELYETLETATDRAEDVANVLESIVLKSA